MVALGLALLAFRVPASASSIGTPGASLPVPPPGAVGGLAPNVQAECGPAAAGAASCLALRRTDVAPRSRALVTAATPPSGYSPADLLSAYALAGAASSGGSGATIAIVDAFDAPNAESDLATYRAQFGLPACTTNNGCFRKVDQSGGTAYPPFDAGWAGEIALDIEMVSAICPNCHILLVEANSASLGDLGTAVNTAVGMGAVAVSNSYSGDESQIGAGEPVLDAAYYTHPGVVITASSGDLGYGAGSQFPADSPHVIAVGGTTLQRAVNARGWTETAWSGGGSGCSAYETKPAWQTDPGCPRRTVADVAAVGDPSTGVALYAAGLGGWLVFGGTSVSAPIIAAAYVLAGTPTAGTFPGQYPYIRGGLNDVTSGSNGSCGGSYLCTARSGFDGPTGLGTPNGPAPFVPVARPGAPTSVTAAAGNASAQVSWSAPASDGGGAITGYTATSAPGGLSCATTGALSCAVPGLTNGTAYTFTVTATNAIGTGPASAPSAAVTPRTFPGAPTGVTAIAGNASAQVSWSAPASDGGGAITGYTATSAPGGLSCTTTGARSCTVDGLANGTPYSFTVTATNIVGTGPASAPSALVTPQAVPGAPVGVTAVAGTLSATVSWSAPASDGGSPITAYTVTSAPGSRTCTTTGSLSCVVPGLANGTPYTFTATATNADGTGPASTASAPVTLTATAVGCTPGTGGGTAFVVTGGTVDCTGTAGSGAAFTGWTASGLSPGTSTAVTQPFTAGSPGSGSIVAAYTDGIGSHQVTFGYTIASVPGAPTGASASASDASARVSWTAPADNGGSPITGYAVTSSPDGKTCTTPGPLSCTVGGLANGTAYTFTVTASNAAGPSLPSAPSAVVMPLAGATYVALTPVRLLDTRTGNGLGGAFVSAVPRTFAVAGRGGVPATATAVTGILTVTGSTSGGYVALGPLATATPSTSTLNFPSGDTRATGVTVTLGAGGTLSAVFRGSGGTTALVFDVTGYFTPDTSGATYVAMTPVRLLDTRTGNGLGGAFVSAVPRTFAVAGRGGVPATATAVTGILTVTGSTSGGYVALGPLATATPSTSTLNFPKGDTRATGVTVTLGAGGTLSAVFRGSGGTTALVFDVTGYFTPDTSGATYVAMTPVRLLDTRTGNGLGGAFVSAVPRTFAVAGRGGVPATATAVTGILTVTGSTSGGYVALGPLATATPSTSTLNFPKGDTRATGVTVTLGAGGTLSAVFRGSGGTTALVFDVTGYFVH